MDAVPAARASELDMLEFANGNGKDYQPPYLPTGLIQDNIDGMVLRLPESRTDCPGAKYDAFVTL